MQNEQNKMVLSQSICHSLNFVDKPSRHHKIFFIKVIKHVQINKPHIHYSHHGWVYVHSLCLTQKKRGLYLYVYTNHMWSYEISSKCEFGEDTALKLLTVTLQFFFPDPLCSSLEFSGIYCTMCELWIGSQKRKFCEKCDISHFMIVQPSVSLMQKGRVMSAAWPLTSTRMVITLWGPPLPCILFTQSCLRQIHPNVICPAFGRLFAQGLGGTHASHYWGMLGFYRVL